MSNSVGIYAAANQVFETRRQENQKATLRNREKAYKKVPELVNIEKQLKELAIKGIKVAIEAKSEAESKKAVKQCKAQSLELQAKRAELLYSAGLNLNILDEVVSCKKCNDSGYIGVQMCDCFKKELRLQRYMRSNLGAMLTEQSFKNFDLNYYSDKVDKKLDTSPRAHMEQVVKYLKKYCDKLEKNPENLFFTGMPGLGKTFLSTAVAKAVIDNGFDVIYETSNKIFSTYQRAQFEQDEQARADIEEYINTDLLIIDDLGAEFTTSFTVTALFNLINSRLIAKKPIIINSNLTLDEIGDKYDERILSRISGEFTSIYFFGKDIRNQKLATRAKKS